MDQEPKELTRRLIGAFHVPDGTMVTTVLFARETIARNEVDPLGRLVTIFTSRTTSVIRERRYFA